MDAFHMDALGAAPHPSQGHSAYMNSVPYAKSTKIKHLLQNICKSLSLSFSFSLSLSLSLFLYIHSHLYTNRLINTHIYVHTLNANKLWESLFIVCACKGCFSSPCSLLQRFGCMPKSHICLSFVWSAMARYKWQYILPLLYHDFHIMAYTLAELLYIGPTN